MAKKTRERTARREGERSLRKVARLQDRAATLAVGGAPDRPIVVASASVIPVRARSLPCPLCAGALRLDDDTAEIVDGRRLRAAHVACVTCGVKRTIWFELGATGANWS